MWPVIVSTGNRQVFILSAEGAGYESPVQAKSRPWGYCQRFVLRAHAGDRGPTTRPNHIFNSRTFGIQYENHESLLTGEIDRAL